MKICKKCGSTDRDKRNKCKPCGKEYVAACRKRNPTRYKAINRKSQLKGCYGITPEEFNKLLEQQEGKCAICASLKANTVDHCHKTGKIRGILCRSCNVAIGFFLDNPNIMRQAASYVETR